MKRAIIAAAIALLSSQASADFDFFDQTHLMAVEQGGVLSVKADALANGGFETSEGTYVPNSRWYTSKWTDARIEFITTVTPSFGITWGFSTGEYARKYKIAPSLKLGFISMHQLSKASSLTIRAYHTIGGSLHEKPCEADYGEIGGVQSVNCRMAATELAPADTLQYLVNARPHNATKITVDFRYEF